MPLTWRNACKRLDNSPEDFCAAAFKEIQKPYSCFNHLLRPLREETHNRDKRNISNFNLLFALQCVTQLDLPRQSKLFGEITEQNTGYIRRHLVFYAICLLH